MGLSMMTESGPRSSTLGLPRAGMTDWDAVQRATQRRRLLDLVRGDPPTHLRNMRPRQLAALVDALSDDQVQERLTNYPRPPVAVGEQNDDSANLLTALHRAVRRFALSSF